MKVDVTVTAGGQAVQGLARDQLDATGADGQRRNPRHRDPARCRVEDRSERRAACRARTTSKTTRPPTWRSSRSDRGDLLAAVTRGPAACGLAVNLWRWPRRSPTPRGSSRSRPRRVAVVALALVRAAERRAAAPAPRAAVVLGEQGEQDLVAHAAAMQQAFEALQRVRRARRRRAWTRGSPDVEQALRGAIAHRALVRYDAYNELSGHQSMSIALLDDERSGIVLSCIHHRDQARVYGKQVRGRQGRTGALARGGRGGAPGARGRRASDSTRMSQTRSP